jgi:hypothetical protein
MLSSRALYALLSRTGRRLVLDVRVVSKSSSQSLTLERAATAGAHRSLYVEQRDVAFHRDLPAKGIYRLNATNPYARDGNLSRTSRRLSLGYRCPRRTDGRQIMNFC